MRTYGRITNNTEEPAKVYLTKIDLVGKIPSKTVDSGKNTGIYPIKVEDYYELVGSGIAKMTIGNGSDGEIIAIADMDYID